MPILKENINKLLKACREELDSYGEGLDGDLEKMSSLVLNIIEKYSKDFRETLEGSIETYYEVSVGAKIKEILFIQFRDTIRKIDSFTSLSDEIISVAIKNATGIRSSLFIPEQAFEMLIKKLVSKLREPSLMCLQQVLDELKQIDQIIRIKEFNTYPNLGATIMQIVDEMLARFAKPAFHMIENLFKVEMTYINIEHPDFIEGSKVITESQSEALKQVDETPFIIDKDNHSFHNPMMFESSKRTPEKTNETKENEVRDLIVIKKLIESYYKIVKKNIEDAVPKVIMSFLVNKAKLKIQTELVSNVYKEEKIYSLMEEPSDINEKRIKCKELLRSFERANSIINKVRHFT